MDIYYFFLGDDDERDDAKLAIKVPRSMYFLRKFAELQLLMLQHNAGLTASHPYASGPINWPFLISGISFWTDPESHKQIYFIGNVMGWWVCTVALSIYIGILGADLLARRRAMDPIPDREWFIFVLSSSSHFISAVRNRLWNNAGFFLLIWAVHYIPFFLMNRQLFVHHYLASHVASALIAGAVLNFVLSETINYPISIRGPKIRKVRPSQHSDIGLKGPVILVFFALIMFLMFVFIAPLTYGTPG